MAKQPKKIEAEKAVPDAAQKTIVFARPHIECPTFYSNIAQVQTSKSDVKLFLCQRIEQTDTKHVVNPQVVVYLPLDHAKKIADVILAQLAKIGYLEAVAAAEAEKDK